MQKRHDRSRTTVQSAAKTINPIGELYRIAEVAKLAHHSEDWVDRLARLPNSPLVAVRRPGSDRIIGFTEKSVRAFLNGETSEKGAK